MRVLTDSLVLPRSRATTRNLGWVVKPLVVWAIWRVAHLVLMVAAGGRPDIWWDDGYYQTILRQGYRPFPPYGVWQQTNFFPLLPWITSAVQFVVRSEAVAIHLVLTSAQIAAVLLLYVLARRWRDERIALTAVALLLLVPPSVFLWMFFTEGLFLALSMGAILAAEDDRPLLAGLLGIGVAATRSVGILITIPLALAAWQHRRTIDRRLVWTALPVLGIAAVMFAQWVQADDALGFVHTSKYWETHAQLPISTFFERIDYVMETHLTTTTPIDIAAVVLAVALGVHAFRIALPWSHRAWLWLMVLAPLSSGLLFSWSRYMMSAWPAFLVGAEVVSRRPRATQIAIATLFVILTVNRILVWHDGWFIG
jgi:hypothetical protein